MKFECQYIELKKQFDLKQYIYGYISANNFHTHVDLWF